MTNPLHEFEHRAVGAALDKAISSVRARLAAGGIDAEVVRRILTEP